MADRPWWSKLYLEFGPLFTSHLWRFVRVLRILVLYTPVSLGYALVKLSLYLYQSYALRYPHKSPTSFFVRPRQLCVCTFDRGALLSEPTIEADHQPDDLERRQCSKFTTGRPAGVSDTRGYNESVPWIFHEILWSPQLNERCSALFHDRMKRKRRRDNLWRLWQVV